MTTRQCRLFAFTLLCLLLSPLFTACGGGEDLEEVEQPPRIPSGCAAIPRPAACI